MDQLPDLPPVYEPVVVDRADSALAEAARLAACGADEGTLVWVRDETAAPGGADRPGPGAGDDLHCAVVLRPEHGRDRMAEVGFVAAVAAGAAVASLIDPMTGLRYRWPDRLLVNELPAGRVRLAAAPGPADPAPWQVVALSVLVGSEPDPGFPAFNSLHASGSREVAVAAVLEAFARQFLSWINRWADDGFGPVLRAWRQRADGMGEAFEIGTGGEAVRGTASEVDADGALWIDTGAGERKRIAPGPVFGLD